jgi:diguanylate cyclase (GGDEF)-like protein/PAS domain S-box-containing protein
LSESEGHPWDLRAGRRTRASARLDNREQPADTTRSDPPSTRLERIIKTQHEIAAANLDLRGVMGLICDRTLELTRADGSSILLLENDELVHRAGTGFMSDRVGEGLSLEGTFCGTAYVNNRSAICDDSDTLARFSARARKRGLRSMVVVPLRHGELNVGVLTVLSRSPNAFTEQDLETLELLSVVLSAAISLAAEVEALSRFRTVFEGASFGIATIDSAGHALEANPALEQMLGYTAAELETISLAEICHPDDQAAGLGLFRELMEGKRDSFQFQKRYYRKDGKLIWSQNRAVLQRDSEGNPNACITMFESITERKLAEAALTDQSALNEHQALHDSLTGLPNRSMFSNRIEQALHVARCDGGRLAVLMIDLDRFKDINDSLGHHIGDELLKEIAGRLQSSVRASDTVARLGGDEFGLLLPSQSDQADMVAIVDKIRRAVEQPILLGDLLLSAETTVGVSRFPEDGSDVRVLIRHADSALWAAKDSGSGHAFYDADLDKHDPGRLTLLGELRRGLDREELVLYYQPKARLANGEVTSVEALVRWIHPERGLIPPDEFIPLAEQTGLIKPLTLYVLNAALRQVCTWRQEGRPLSVAVNLSWRNLHDLDFPDQVEELLLKWQADPGMLELEITESAMLTDPNRSQVVLNRLAAMGFRLSIDDFGTGYTSLGHLKRLPVGEIKIDRSFVTHMAANSDDAVIVHALVDLARNLGLDVVAEGIETRETWDRLRALGCTLAQGYYLSPPLPADELAEWLDRRTRPASKPRAPRRFAAHAS